MCSPPPANSQSHFPPPEGTWSGKIPTVRQKYIRDRNGKTTFYAEVDTQGIGKHCLNVKVDRNIVIIRANNKWRTKDGDLFSRELHRQLELPPTVDSTSLSCRFVEPSTLVIEAPVRDALGPNVNQSRFTGNRILPTIPPVPDPLGRSISDPRRVTFLEPLAQTQPLPRRPSIPDVPSNPNPRFRQHPMGSNPKPDSRGQLSPITLHQSHGPAMPTSTSSTGGMFTLKIGLGTDVTPENLRVTRKDGILYVHAKRRAPELNPTHGSGKNTQLAVFEHRSEHTLPGNISLFALSARLHGGVLYVSAPYVLPRSTRSPAPVLNTHISTGEVISPISRK